MNECRNCEHATLEIIPCRECYAELRARVSTLEAEINKCTKVLEQVDFTSGCNGQKCISGHIQTLINTVSALEAEIEIGARHYNQVSALLDMECKENEAFRARIAALESAWRDLPPMPESRHDH